jgi:hypothetical protein
MGFQSVAAALVLVVTVSGCQASQPAGAGEDGGSSQADAAPTVTAPQPGTELGTPVTFDASLSQDAATNLGDALVPTHDAALSPVLAHDAGVATKDSSAPDSRPSCADVTCAATEVCEPATGTCIDPCDAVQCGPTEVCISTVHGLAVGQCVDGHQCDCGNCGNCGEDGTFVGEQAFCGNPAGAPATMACTKSCENGEGCIPFGQDTAGNPASLCWAGEGCFGT